MIADLNLYFLLIVKIFSITAVGLYIIFALIVVKQISMMTKNVNDMFNGVLIAFSYLHLAFSVFLILLTLTVL